MRRKKGFTLVEVCLVMLVFGIAISSLLAFFPVSLRQSNMAVTDTVTTMFADYVINSLQANAAEMTDWDVWAENNGRNFEAEIVKGIKLDNSKDLDYLPNDDVQRLEDYLGVPKSYIGYQLDFRKEKGGRLWQIVLYVTDNRTISDREHMQAFTSHVVFLGGRKKEKE